MLTTKIERLLMKNVINSMKTLAVTFIFIIGMISRIGTIVGGDGGGDGDDALMCQEHGLQLKK